MGAGKPDVLVLVPSMAGAERGRSTVMFCAREA